MDKYHVGCYVQGDAADCLSTYEDAEEAGLLVRLPCKIGDVLYEPTYMGTITENKVVAFRIELFSVWIEWRRVSGVVFSSIGGVEISEIGKTVFLSRKEAEAALANGAMKERSLRNGE